MGMAKPCSSRRESGSGPEIPLVPRRDHERPFGKPERARGAAGKLREVARAWALARLGKADDRQPVVIDEEITQQFARMGVAINGRGAVPAGEAIEVDMTNADALDAWIACETQWRIAATMSGLIWLGLDYAGADVVLRRLGFDEPDKVFADLQVMEGAALKTFGEHRQ